MATITWDGGAGNFNWFSANNWDTNTVPTATDDAVINDLVGTPSIVVDATTTVQSITSAERVAFSSGTITISNVSTFTVGLDLASGTLSSNAAILTTLGSVSNWSGGQLGRSGTSTNVANQGTWNFTGASSRNLQNAVFNNEWIFVQSAGQLVINTSTFTNTTTGVYTHQSGTANPAITTASGTFQNAGSYLYVSTGIGSVSGTFNNSGQVILNQATGDFTLPGGGTHSGSFQPTTGAQIRFPGGTTTFGTGVSFSGGGTTRISAGTYNVTDNVSGTGLSLEGGTTSIASGTILTLSGTNNLAAATISGLGKIVNTGTLNMASSSGPSVSRFRHLYQSARARS